MTQGNKKNQRNATAVLWDRWKGWCFFQWVKTVALVLSWMHEESTQVFTRALCSCSKGKTMELDLVCGTSNSGKNKKANKPSSHEIRSDHGKQTKPIKTPMLICWFVKQWNIMEATGRLDQQDKPSSQSRSFALIWCSDWRNRWFKLWRTVLEHLFYLVFLKKADDMALGL